jgi:hypothetical protein
MAVLSYAEASINQEMYDGFMGQVGDKLAAAPGFIAHLAGPTASGWGVTEVWESQAAAETFFRDTVAPMFEAAGGAMPAVQFRPLHNVMLGSRG